MLRFDAPAVFEGVPLSEHIGSEIGRAGVEVIAYTDGTIVVTQVDEPDRDAVAQAIAGYTLG